MNQTEFEKKYHEIVTHAALCLAKYHREGLYSLEDEMDFNKVKERDIFEYGLQLLIDRLDKEYIDEILSNIINQEQKIDEKERVLNIIKKRAVLLIHDKVTPRVLRAILNSFTAINLDKDKLRQDDIIDFPGTDDEFLLG
jgi:hypothetical protein